MTVVLKVGGASTGGVAEAIAALAENGEPVCVVHGAGPQISDEMARRGLVVRFVGGRRVTTPEALEVVRESFASVNAAVCAAVGAPAVTASWPVPPGRNSPSATRPEASNCFNAVVTGPTPVPKRRARSAA